MATAEELIETAKRLPAQERRRLVDALERTLTEESSADGEGTTSAKRLAALDKALELAGTFHSDFSDVSSNKYEHLAEAYTDKR